jgi:hypothetical protein
VLPCGTIYRTVDPTPPRGAQPMRRRHDRSSIEELRLTIDCLPRHTRIAMLQGVAENEIIVGAYSDRVGGVCPMLAAHRCGGRTSFISFARAWDRFTRVRHARRATEREVGVLRAHLEASLMADDRNAELGTAVRDHQALARDRRAREAAAGGHGWDWLAEQDRAAAPAAPAADDAQQPELV